MFKVYGFKSSRVYESGGKEGKGIKELGKVYIGVG